MSLKISKNQITKGQKVMVDLSNYKDNWEDNYDKEFFTNKGLKTGDFLFLESISGTVVSVKDEKGNDLRFWWQPFKKGTTEVGENLGSENVEYVIYLNGKKYKQKKFKDLGKVKASFLNMMDYHRLFHKKSKEHLDTCPEHDGYVVSEWLEYGDNLSRDEFSKVEVFEWSDRKLGKKANIDPVRFYDEQMFLINVSSKYGSCVREIYKKMKETHKYIFVFVHEDYQKKNMYVTDYAELKESQIIKDALKASKLKNTLKATKNGKTAVAVDTATDAATIIFNLPENSKYYAIDINGNELKLVENQLVLAESRNERIDSIFED